MSNSAKQKRLRLGILFDFQASWMGGVTYILNLVKTLNYLDDKDKPEVFFFYTKELEEYIKEIEYPYITFVKKVSPPLVKGFISSWFKRKNVFVDELIAQYALQAIYPNRNYPVKNRTNAKVVAWYADLQHKYYPEFFTRQTLIHRAVRLFFMMRNANDIVVSSQAVKDDFYKFYKVRKKQYFHIFHFVSINEVVNNIEFNDLKEKYALPDNYFMVSNQFHKHKNHKTVLLALAKLKEQGIKKHIVFTGRFPKAKNSPYIAEIYNILDKYDLHQDISMLGVIPRNDQIQIMKYSQAVIQPSLFEGWSTVIEDAISINVPVIASSLPVNIEQLKDKGWYFDAEDVNKLSDVLDKFPQRGESTVDYGDYTLRIKDSIEKLMKVFTSKSYNDR